MTRDRDDCGNVVKFQACLALNARHVPNEQSRLNLGNGVALEWFLGAFWDFERGRYKDRGAMIATHLVVARIQACMAWVAIGRAG